MSRREEQLKKIMKHKEEEFRKEMEKRDMGSVKEVAAQSRSILQQSS